MVNTACIEEEEATRINLDNQAAGFCLVLAAGLSTAVGASFIFIGPVVKRANKRVLAAGLGFSGGVMIYVSFVEIFFKSTGAFEADGYEEKHAYWLATLCFFSGMLLLRLISFVVHRLDTNHGHACVGQGGETNTQPDQQQEQEDRQPPGGGTEMEDLKKENNRLKEMMAELGMREPNDKDLEKMGLDTALAIAIHNFPEGLATFVATLADTSVGVTLAIAIAIHNVPEGLCVALPIYYSTNKKLKAFMWALLSGLSEPVGAFIGWLIIKSTGDDMNQAVYGVLFGIVGGMMVMIVLLELLPTACRYDPKDSVVTNGLACGMLVMAASLCLFVA